MAGITTPGGNYIDPDQTFATTGQGINEQTGQPTPGVNQSGVGGFLQGVGQVLTGSNNPFTNASFLPAMGMAAQQFYNAGQYRDLGNQAADRADPFGPSRAGYIARLNHLYEDPSSIADTPGYKFALDQALDATQGRLASMGFGGTGTMADALSTQASGLAQQTFNNERNALMQMSGVQFDPANAASMQMKGGELALDAQSNALGAMMYPFGPGAGGTTINNNGGPGGKNNGGSNLQSRLSQAVSSGLIKPADAAQLFQRLITSQGDISDGDIQLLNSLGIDNNVDLGGVDYAPGSYDFNGFAGYGPDINSSTGAILDSQSGNPFDYQDITGAGFPVGDITSDVDMSGFQVDPWS